MSGGGGLPSRGRYAAMGKANQYHPDWMKQTKATLEDDLRDRGIEPPRQKRDPWGFILTALTNPGILLIAGAIIALVMLVLS